MTEVLRLKRTTFTEKATVGELYLPDGVFACFTLEDRVRNHKVPKETAIPAGAYEVVVAWSNRFERLMPRLLNVPFYQGILIHSGNTPAHTEGCILIGRKKAEDAVYESILAFEEFFPKIKKLTEKGKLYLLIEGGFKSDEWLIPQTS